MKQITITTTTGTVTFTLAKGAIPTQKGGNLIIETKDAGTKTLPTSRMRKTSARIPTTCRWGWSGGSTGR